ncbi:hypothetical protein ACFY71_40460 [Streptomyces cinerochromogenes]|uniref:Uncharacterized protein n=1 Tax=Streptomyces cinerochromogenes TaxID=66422 RepID=A0ABW7BDI5_9ACTN
MAPVIRPDLGSPSAAPHLSCRHTDKPTPAKQKQTRTASNTGALADMCKHGLVENGGSTEAQLRNPFGERGRHP